MQSVADERNGLDVVVHFGAHKTATTFLQHFLKSEMSELRSNGVGYIPMDVFRASVLPFVAQAARSADPGELSGPDAVKLIIARAIESDIPDAAPVRRLLISDENLAGPTLALLTKGTLYSMASSRLRVLVDQLPGAKVKLLFCIRDYADFIPSVYCELLRKQKLAPLTKMLSRNRELSLSWPAFLADIAARLPECDIQYWRYEDFSGSPGDVVEAMTGLRLESIQSRIARKVRPSLTGKAVKILHAARHHLTVEEHRQLAECLVERMKFAGDGKVTIEDPQLAEAFRAQYIKDTDELRDMSEPVTGIVRRIRK